MSSNIECMLTGIFISQYSIRAKGRNVGKTTRKPTKKIYINKNLNAVITNKVSDRELIFKLCQISGYRRLFSTSLVIASLMLGACSGEEDVNEAAGGIINEIDPTQTPVPAASLSPAPEQTSTPTATSVPTPQQTAIPAVTPTPVPEQTPAPRVPIVPLPGPTQEPTPVITEEPSPEPTEEPAPTEGGDVLVFTKTSGFTHGSIGNGEAMIAELASQNSWNVEFTDDANDINPEKLSNFNVVVWLSTSGNVLNGTQESAFQDYIENGGGYVGIHAASDTEHDWEWYGDLVGAYFARHPSIQTATIHVEDPGHPSTTHLDDTWVRRDEWYNFNHNPRIETGVNVVLTLDESTYNPGAQAMGADHPIAWYKTIGQGRSFYTGLGHTDASFSEDFFRQHVEGAINWAGSLNGE